MGLTVLNVQVGNPSNPKKLKELEFLVDSGAVHSVVSVSVLRELKIKPVKKEEFRLANGERIVRKKGFAFFKYGERIGGADVIFGEKGDSVLLGALTLEALGLSLDPLRRELKELPMMLAVTSTSTPKN
ncbi:MAG: aspartyl protease family protein [Ignavibacteriales bacterium]|nr:aspartyl protease family protein [Ignavibacteriales bacterium]